MTTFRLEPAPNPRWKGESGRRSRLATVFSLIVLASGMAPAIDKTEEPPSAASSLSVEFKSGRLTLDAVNAPLDDVLHAIGEEAKIAIDSRGDFGPGITISFAAVPLEEALGRLLRGQSFALSYDQPAGDAGKRRVKHIWVMAHEPPQTAKSAGKASTPAEWRVQLQRVRALIRRKDAAAIAELSNLAKGDSSSVVRSQALRGVKNLKGRNSISDLHAVLINDPDPAVRQQAVRLAGEIQAPEVPWLLRQAESDKDASVRRVATQVLRNWEHRFGARNDAAARARR